ncbi:MAG: SUMF1/EgtB/PvdO family nonheme iron enzyme [Anaerolineales bacterium]|nr:SUMF1/EgtB/PvdO family nonheme iron enzyme [Anaerolineales bacterium]
MLAKLGDPRPEVTDVLAMHFCHVPAGPFVMDEGKEQYTHDLAYAYWVARFPVTNAQYQAFVAAGGYADKRWWREAQQASYWKDGKARSWRVDDWRSTAFDYGDPYNLPNHPVVGVTWYEALAFSRWLDEHYGKAGVLPRRAACQPAQRARMGEGGARRPVAPGRVAALCSGRSAGRYAGVAVQSQPHAGAALPVGRRSRRRTRQRRRKPGGKFERSGRVCHRRQPLRC